HTGRLHHAATSHPEKPDPVPPADRPPQKYSHPPSVIPDRRDTPRDTQPAPARSHVECVAVPDALQGPRADVAPCQREKAAGVVQRRLRERKAGKRARSLPGTKTACVLRSGRKGA